MHWVQVAHDRTVKLWILRGVVYEKKIKKLLPQLCGVYGTHAKMYFFIQQVIIEQLLLLDAVLGAGFIQA